MRKKSYLIGAFAIVTLSLLILVRIAPWQKKTTMQRNPAMSGAVNVKAHVLATERLEERINTTGTLLANEAIELTSETNGKVTKIYFNEGSHVKQGDVLVQINDAELQAELQRALYQKKLAESSELRQRQQLEIEAISQEEYDIALNRVNILQAEMELLQAQLEKTTISAPFNGRVGLRYVSEGSYVTSNTVIATLVDSDPIKIEFSIPERYANAVKNGQEILFRVQGNSEKNRAVIYAIEPEINVNTRSLHLRAACPNPQGLFVPGSFAEVEVLLRISEQALMTPSQSLIPELEKQTLFLYKNGKAVVSDVEIGVRNAQKIQILSGAVAGDTVITSGILQLRLNSPVKIVAFE